MSISVSPPVHDSAWFGELIRQNLPDISLSDEQVHALHRHFEVLMRWNQRMDLTSLVAPEAIVARHYCESLFFGAHLSDERPGLTILDIGSGAGFPGVPVAVLHPEWQITLLEANQRRAVFLKEATRGLANVRVVAERAERFAVRHDWVIARAVNVQEVLSCVPRLGRNVGMLIGETGLNTLMGAENFSWADPLPLPGSDRRYCVCGTCST